MLISQGLYIFLVVSSILGLLFGLIGTIIGSSALIKTIAAEKSTHNITYMPVDEEIDKANKEFVRDNREEWQTRSAELVKQNELYKEDLEENMPDFYMSEDDNKITSY